MKMNASALQKINEHHFKRIGNYINIAIGTRKTILNFTHSMKYLKPISFILIAAAFAGCNGLGKMSKKCTLLNMK